MPDLSPVSPAHAPPSPAMPWPTPGALPDDLAGRYVDSSVCDLRQLGRAHHDLADRLNTNQAARVLWVGTCQRLEAYWLAGEPSPPQAHPLERLARQVQGALALQQRLSEVAAGVRSQLLGDRFITAQVSRAVRCLDPRHALAGWAREALAVARYTRQFLGFTAALDYEALAFDILARLDGAATATRTLLVVGGGLLARAVTTSPRASAYRRVVVVTRSPRRLRRQLNGSGERLVVTRLERAGGLLAGGAVNAVVATTRLDPTYRAGVAEVLLGPYCQAVLDLGSVPVLDAAHAVDDRYVSMYDAPVLERIEQQNAKVAQVAAAVRSMIEGYYARKGGHL